MKALTSWFAKVSKRVKIIFGVVLVVNLSVGMALSANSLFGRGFASASTVSSLNRLVADAGTQTTYLLQASNGGDQATQFAKADAISLDILSIESSLISANAYPQSLVRDIAQYRKAESALRSAIANAKAASGGELSAITKALNNLRSQVATEIHSENYKAQKAKLTAGLETIFMMAFGSILALVLYRKFSRSQVEGAIRATRARLQTANKYQTLIDRSQDLLVVLDAKCDVQFAAPAWGRLFGFAKESFVGSYFVDIVAERDRSIFLGELQSVRPNEVREVEFAVIDADGSSRCLSATLSNYLDSTQLAGIIINARDISESKALQEELIHNAFYDSLTSLPNRILFSERLKGEIAMADFAPLHVLFIDLDDFKVINDTYNHSVGDELLAQVALRLREVAGERVTIGRLSGDEFAMILSSGEKPAFVAEEIKYSLGRPFDLSIGEVFVRASIGGARCDSSKTEAEALLRDADVAMYVAKKGGKGRFALFEPKMHQEIAERLKLKADLAGAIERDEFFVVYQPVVDMNTEEIAGVEALVRWQHHELGLIPPGVFIPIAEESRAIVDIDRGVLLKATTQVASWNRLRAEGKKLSLNVNLSVIELSEEDVVEAVTEIVQKSGIDPKLLILEITETVFMANPKAFIDKINQIKALGIRIAIDDFGTGYSSLSFLEELPIDVLKVDKSFTDRLTTGEVPVTLRTIIQLARALSLKLVIEGIEQEIQMERLVDLGCTFGQGYHFSKPKTSEDLEGMIFGGDADALRRFALDRNLRSGASLRYEVSVDGGVNDKSTR
ncbi:MAG: EAL domain-containing protein [Actinomycetota bacterium]|nr:EAL domain-containing protein [Actinomycetota bacterium]